MHHVLRLTPLGKPAAEPIPLDRRRRRLSTIMARHNTAGPRVLAFKVPAGQPLDMERHVIPRSRWKDTLVGANDNVVILPLISGGGGGRGGAGKAMSIALALAGIALIALGQFYAVGAMIGNGLNIGVNAGNAIWSGISAGLLLGASVLAQSMMTSKANNPKQLYGVSGGGNTARMWERIPVTYGRTWVKPDITQVDYFFYDGDDIVLVKRLSVGLGKYNLKNIRVGDSIFWNSTDGIKPPFNFNLDANKGAAVEVLYGQPSTILPGNIYSSPSVTGFQIARVIDNPALSGPFPVCLPGSKVAKIQIDMSWPNGVFTRAEKSGNLNAATVNVYWQYREIDDLGVPVGDGSWAQLHRVFGVWKSQDPIRKTEIIDVPLGRYEVQAYSVDNHQENVSNDVYWDGLRGLFDDTVVREGRTEVVMRVRSGKSLSVTSFSDVQMEVARVLPVWDGSFWTDTETRLAKWAAVDILRADYGASLPDSGIDLVKFLALTLTEDDEFNGTVNGPVSVWEALGTVLAPIRAEVVKFGNVYSYVRDEPKTMRQHVITRRNIVQDSSSITFDLGTDRSAGDVIVDILYEGDPKRPITVRSTVSAESKTPKRLQVVGINDPYHAKRYADFHAAVSAFRQETRDITVEYDGRLYAPGDLAYVDTWFWSARQAAQIEGNSGRNLYLDGKPDVTTYPYAVLRDRKGKRFGPIAVTIGDEPNIVVLDATDLAAAEAEADTTLPDVLAAPGQDDTPIQFGTLTDLQQNYLVKSAVPDGPDRVKVSLIYDDPRVWDYIGANMPVYTPPSAVNPDFPVVIGVSAWVTQNDTRLTLHWAARLAAYAPMKEVELSYDEGLLWTNIYTGPAVNGTSPINYNESGPVWLRVRAIGESGAPGDWATPVIFTTPKPVVNGEFIGDDTILNQAIDAAARVDALKSQIEDLGEKYRQLAKIATNDQAVTANDLRQVRVERDAGDIRTTAAFIEEISLVADDVGALADRTQDLEATVDTPGTGLSARVSDHDVAIVDLDSDLTALAGRTTTVEGKVPGGNAQSTLELVAGVTGGSVLSEILLRAKATANGQDSTAALILRALSPLVSGGPPIGQVVIDARTGLIGYTDNGGTFRPLLSYSSVDDFVTIQNLRILGSLIVPGDLTRGFSQQLSGITVGTYAYPTPTFPNVNMQNASTTILWTDWLSQNLTLDDKSADDAADYRVRLSCFANGVVKLSDFSPAGGYTILYFRILKGTTVIAGPVQIGLANNGVGAGGTVSGFAGHGETNFLDTVANTGGTVTYKMQLGLQSSGTNRFASADLSTANFSAECIIK